MKYNRTFSIQIEFGNTLVRDIVRGKETLCRSVSEILSLNFNHTPSCLARNEFEFETYDAHSDFPVLLKIVRFVSRRFSSREADSSLVDFNREFLYSPDTRMSLDKSLRNGGFYTLNESKIEYVSVTWDLEKKIFSAAIPFMLGVLFFAIGYLIVKQVRKCRRQRDLKETEMIRRGMGWGGGGDNDETVPSTSYPPVEYGMEFEETEWDNDTVEEKSHASSRSNRSLKHRIARKLKGEADDDVEDDVSVRSELSAASVERMQKSTKPWGMTTTI